jgi:protein-tyrosine kinase
MTNKEKGALRPEEWTVLEQFDRSTGNILKYDQQTGQLDHDSRKLIKETNILRRLIDTGMVLPGGWLTYKGLTECEARWSLIDQGVKSEKGVSASDNGVQIPNNLLSPQAEKFLKTLWNQEDKKPIDLAESMVVENEEKAVSVKTKQQVTPEENLVKLSSETSAAKILYDENAIDKNLVSYFKPQSFEAEQFKILRTHIFFPLSGKIPRIIAITSAVPGEGKSFVAANFAVSIARELDRSVLLIDCDLRKPSIHKMFGFKDDILGLSNYLSEKLELSSLVLPTKVEKLHLLAAGSQVENSSELLSSEQMAAMLNEVTRNNDNRFVILDTSPVIMTAEAMAITRYVDGVLLVARTDYTPKAHLKELIKVIDPEKIIGTVLNYVDMRSLTQYEYKKYGKKYYGQYNTKSEN